MGREGVAPHSAPVRTASSGNDGKGTVMGAPNAGYVLAGVDGGPADAKVLTWAVEEASRRGVGCLLAYGRAAGGGGEDSAVLEAAAEQARAIGVPVRTHSAVSDPVDLLTSLAAGAEVTVVGAGLPRHRLGTVAARLLERATGPVILARGRVGRAIHAVAVGVDGSAAAQDAFAFAVEEARLTGAPLIVASSYWRAEPMPGAVHLSDDGTDVRRTAAEQLVGELTGPYARKYPDLTIIPALSAQPAGAFLASIAADQAGLVVVGDRGRGPIARTVLGSISHGLARHAGCPVAVVRARTEEKP